MSGIAETLDGIIGFPFVGVVDNVPGRYMSRTFVISCLHRARVDGRDMTGIYREAIPRNELATAAKVSSIH